MAVPDMSGALPRGGTFLLGVGAQKAGTTWLYEYLAAAPAAATTSIKEYHIWDALHVPGCHGYLVRGRPEAEQDRLRALMQRDNAIYFAFFERLLQQDGKRLTFDITPSYAGLQPEILRMIAAGFAARNIATKAVFLMRDPVERCWSAARMLHLKKHGDTGISPEDVGAMAESPGFALRTRYDLTLAALEAAFPPEQVHVGIYEEMFEAAPLEKLSGFCGVPFRPEMTQETFNTSAKKTELGPEIYARLARTYRGVYDAVAQAYPQVRQLWPGFRYF